MDGGGGGGGGGGVVASVTALVFRFFLMRNIRSPRVTE